jgi:hypothetical protein
MGTVWPGLCKGPAALQTDTHAGHEQLEPDSLRRQGEVWEVVWTAVSLVAVQGSCKGSRAVLPGMSGGQGDCR